MRPDQFRRFRRRAAAEPVSREPGSGGADIVSFQSQGRAKIWRKPVAYRISS